MTTGPAAAKLMLWSELEPLDSALRLLVKYTQVEWPTERLHADPDF